MWRIHRLSRPAPSSWTLNTNCPSAETVASFTLPVVVSFSMLIFWNGMGPESRCPSIEYTPNPAAARIAATTTVISPARVLCCRAFSISTRPLDPCRSAALAGAEVCGDDGTAAVPVCAVAPEPRLASLSRFSRFRSARISAADW